MSSSLSASLRATVQSDNAAAQDGRWAYGTTVSSSFLVPPLEAYEVWRPLPVSYAQKEAARAMGRHLLSQSAIFPRLNSSLEEVKGKLVPRLTELMAACKALDTQGQGALSTEDVRACIKKTDVFLSSADQDVLLAEAPRTPGGHIKYAALQDVLLGHAGPAALSLTPSGIITGRPAMPTSYSWPDGQGFDVTLRLRPDARPFTLPSAAMQKFAAKLGPLCRLTQDAEKVHAMLRHFMVTDLVVEAGTPGHADLSFRTWLADSGVMSLTTRHVPGPVVPEVYDLMDQVIYGAFSIPVVVPTTQTLTQFCCTMRPALAH